MNNKKCSCSGYMLWLTLAVLFGAVIGYFIGNGCGSMCSKPETSTVMQQEATPEQPMADSEENPA